MPQALASVRNPGWSPRPQADELSRSAVLSTPVFSLRKKNHSSSAAMAFAAMHFDLGLAYWEMGLITDSVREWLFSAEHPSFACESWLLLAQAYVAQEDHACAFAALGWARRRSPTPDQRQRAEALHALISNGVRESVPPSAPVSRIISKSRPEEDAELAAIDLGFESSVDRALDDIFDLS